MERIQKEHRFTFNYFLKCLLSLLINPIWFFFTVANEFYTNLRPFRLTHFTFYHTFLGAFVLFLPVVHKTEQVPFIVDFYPILICLVGGCSSRVSEHAKREAQNLNHVILGFIGMTISVWTLFRSIIAVEFRFYPLIFGLLYFLALCSLLASYFLISNVWLHLYLILPPENQPFFEIKRNVVLVGLFHLSVSITSFFLTKFWPLCCLLLLSSFAFSINGWSCFFTESYILCEHRRYDWDMQKSPIDGVICHVAVRKNLRRMEDPMKLPIGFQFDDKVDTRKLRYRILESEYARIWKEN